METYARGFVAVLVIIVMAHGENPEIKQRGETPGSILTLSKTLDLVQPKSVTDRLLYGTVRIEAINSTKKETSVGTGFLYRFSVGDKAEGIVLITNKHVLTDADICKFRFHEANSEKNGPSGGFIPVGIQDFSKYWIGHPDQGVDLAAIPVGGIFEQLTQAGKAVYVLALDKSVMPTDSQLKELRAVEDIMMVGYPIGLSDEVHNYPLFRKGITASHPMIDFQGKPETVIDIACFPGSSGSPVLIINEGSFGTQSGLTVGTRVMLLGVLYAGPYEVVQGQVQVSPIQTSLAGTTLTRVMVNLGFIIKAREIEALTNYIVEQEEERLNGP